jgi:hypothetical protein
VRTSAIAPRQTTGTVILVADRLTKEIYAPIVMPRSVKSLMRGKNLHR